MNALFSEANQEWQPVPFWVNFLIRLGYGWPAGVLIPRRIALVSMPCDSAAAGLIALGALIRDLGKSDANDVDGHFDALVRHARQYVESCRDCNVRCRPKEANCGYIAEAHGRVKSLRRPYRGYQLTGIADLEERQIVIRRNGTIRVYPAGAKDYYIDGEPPPEIGNREGALSGAAYAALVEGSQIIPNNLRRSFSGLCLAGRVVGESATREACASTRFRSENAEQTLAKLLSIHGWSPSDFISRMTFFNARTERPDRPAPAPSLVVADGDESFLKAIERPEFQRSDLIGVIHRTMDRDRLEGTGNRMAGLRQWYEEDSEMLSSLSPVPRGIGVLILRKRVA